MSRGSKTVSFLLRAALAVSILLFVFYQIQRRTLQVSFRLAEPEPSKANATYSDGATGAFLVAILDDRRDGTLDTVLVRGSAGAIPESGVLVKHQGKGPQRLAWSSVTIAPAGWQLMHRVLVHALRAWPWLAAGWLLILGAILLGAVRWAAVPMTPHANPAR